MSPPCHEVQSVGAQSTGQKCGSRRAAGQALDPHVGRSGGCTWGCGHRWRERVRVTMRPGRPAHSPLTRAPAFTALPWPLFPCIHSEDPEPAPAPFPKVCTPLHSPLRHRIRAPRIHSRVPQTHTAPGPRPHIPGLQANYLGSGAPDPAAPGAPARARTTTPTMLCSRAAAGEIGGAAVTGHISAASTLVTALLRSDRPSRGVTHTCRRLSCRSLYRPALVTLQVTRPPRGAGLGAARGAWLTPVRPPDATAAPTGPLSRSPVPSPPGPTLPPTAALDHDPSALPHPPVHHPATGCSSH